ncbi:MAG: 50S ribosomal protein L22 [Planctomycetaceae bacterium]|jgi:large subunit ribosomal protein L22|nr:50S ribosomal protein L22 [Planctomycetaceae bacterium]
MFYVAKHQFARMSAQKIRPFADLIRGKNVEVALSVLKYHPNRGARLVEAVLKSAIANAEDQRASRPSDMEVLDCRVNGGPMTRRWRAKARGMSMVIKKRTSHITVEIG